MNIVALLGEQYNWYEGSAGKFFGVLLDLKKQIEVALFVGNELLDLFNNVSCCILRCF